MYYILIAGPAGSGKSTLVRSLSDWLEDHQMDVVRVNFDPAAEVVPYVPDVDVRRFINARELMSKKGLGPNGALVASVDYLVNYVLEIREEIEESRSNYALIDLPGQLEVIAFRRLGPIIIKELTKDRKSVLVFLVDVRLASDPPSALSMALLAVSTLYRMELPMTLAINKVDLIAEPSALMGVNGEELSRKIYLIKLLSDEYGCSEVGSLAFYIDPEISEHICKAVKEILYDIVPVSAKESYGIDTLYASIQRVLAGGEDYLTEEPSGYY